MSKLLKFYPTFLIGLSLAPYAAAQTGPDTLQVTGLITQFENTLNLIIIFLFVLATVIFIWGVIMYIAQSDDEAARKKARMFMLWGIIGLAVITAVWGIVNLIITYFGFDTATPIPTAPGEAI